MKWQERNKMRLTGWLTIVIFSLSLVQCKNNPNIEGTLYKMKSAPIVVDVSEYEAVYEPTDVTKRYKQHGCPTYLMYVDSMRCSPCKLSNLPCLDDYRREVEAKYGRMNFLVIYEPSSSDSVSINDFVDTTSFSIPVYKDCNHVFSRHNGHIPDEDCYHDFLMDEKGRIIVVGCPILSKKVEQLFQQALDSLFDNPKFISGA